MIAFQSREKYGVYDLQKLIKLLRSPDGCPWDREQTHASIRRNFIEEAYEAAEAIDNGDAVHLREELGDVLTQVVFHADIEEDAGSFDLDGVADATVRKLLFRHPHVFGDVTADSSDEVLANWDEIKRQEKSHDTLADELCAVAKSLPALWRAEKVVKKAGKAGFGTEIPVGQAEELLREAVSRLGKPPLEDDITLTGELLLLCTRITAALGVDPEDALNNATDRFIAEVADEEKFRKD